MAKKLCYKLSMERIKEGAKFKVEGKMFWEYFSIYINRDDNKMDNWLGEDGKKIRLGSFDQSTVPSFMEDIFNISEFDNPHLIRGGKPIITWLCAGEGKPVIIPGVFSEAELDEYKDAFKTGMQKFFSQILKPYRKSVQFFISEK